MLLNNPVLSYWLLMISFSTIFVDRISTSFGLRERWRGILSTVFFFSRLSSLVATLERNQHWNPMKEAAVCIPISLAGRNHSWKVTEGQKLIPVLWCPPRPATLAPLSLAPFEPCSWNVFGIGFGASAA